MADSTEDKDSKTEEPTQYKLDQSREKGDVASSKELTSVFLLTFSALVLSVSALYMYEVLSSFINWIFSLNHSDVTDPKILNEILVKTVQTMFAMLAPLFITTVFMGIFSQVMQIGFIYAPKQLSADINRINPMNGLKRLFSMKSVVEALKGIFKFSLVILITYMVLKHDMGFFVGFLHSELNQVLSIGQIYILKLIFFIIASLAVLAGLDFAWEKYSHKKKLRMSKKELKEELKEKEGSPEIKQKIKSIQREMAQRRMMKELPNADVIITNPTHLSIALKYDSEKMIAPVIIGKGADFVALKIREIAKSHSIPMVENVPLARSLYAEAEVGDPVPRDLYRAVAQVLAYVMKLKKKKKAIGVVA